MTHGFKKCLLDVVQLLTIKKENKAKIVWKALSFLLTLVVNTHIPHIYIHTHTVRSFLSQPFSNTKISKWLWKIFWKKSHHFEIHCLFLGCQVPAPHWVIVQRKWSSEPPGAAFLYKSCQSPGFPYGSSRTEAKGQRHQLLPKQRINQK